LLMSYVIGTLIGDVLCLTGARGSVLAVTMLIQYIVGYWTLSTVVL